MNLSKRTKFTRVAASAVAAQTAVTSSVIDTKGFDTSQFLALLGDVTTACVLGLKVQQGDQSDGSDMADLTGAAVTFTAGATDADDKLLLVEITRPDKRYVRAVLTRTTANAIVDGIVAQQGWPKEMPTSHDAGVIASTLVVSPAES